MPKSKRHLKRRNKKSFHKSCGGTSTSKRWRGGENTPIAKVNRHSELGMVIRHDQRRTRNATPTGLAMRLNREIEDQEHWMTHREHIKRK